MTAITIAKSVAGPMDFLLGLGQLNFLTQPVGVLGLPLVVNPIIQVLTENGILDIGYVGSVTVSASIGGSVSGTVTVPVVLGLATFVGLTVGGSGGISLIASAPGVNPATSNPI